jgi:transposase
VDELIPANHPARLVGEVIDQMGIERLLKKYQEGSGASRMLNEFRERLLKGAMEGTLVTAKREPGIQAVSVT